MASVAITLVTPSLPAGAHNQPLSLLAHGAAFTAALLFGLLEAVVVIFYAKGQNWARWVVMLASALYILGMLLSLQFWALMPAKVMLSVLQAAFGAYLLWFLNTGPVKDWFEDRPVAV